MSHRTPAMKYYLCLLVLCSIWLLSDSYEIRNTHNFVGQPVRCHQCYQSPYCEADQLVECSYERVIETAHHLSFIRDALPVVQTNSYYCTHYTAIYENSTQINVQGCLFNSFNPCDERYKNEQALKWNCKYCNLVDGCNPANMALASVKVLGALLTLIVGLHLMRN